MVACAAPSDGIEVANIRRMGGVAWPRDRRHRGPMRILLCPLCDGAEIPDGGECACSRCGQLRGGHASPRARDAGADQGHRERDRDSELRLMNLDAEAARYQEAECYE